MKVFQNAQRPEGSLQVESPRKTGVLVYNSSWVTLAVTSRREISRRDVTFEALCHVVPWNSHVATSKIEALRHVTTWNYHVATLNLKLSATSRRGFLTSRRQNYISLSRRDVEFSRRDVDFSRRDVTFTRRDVIWSPTLPRRDVDLHVATSFGHALCHVAT